MLDKKHTTDEEAEEEEEQEEVREIFQERRKNLASDKVLGRKEDRLFVLQFPGVDWST